MGDFHYQEKWEMPKFAENSLLTDHHLHQFALPSSLFPSVLSGKVRSASAGRQALDRLGR